MLQAVAALLNIHTHTQVAAAAAAIETVAAICTTTARSLNWRQLCIRLAVAVLLYAAAQ
jgi:hypothetical protein